MDQGPSRKRPRASHSLSRQQSQVPIRPPFTETDQERLGARVARITASCGFPFRWVENEEWLAFLAEFIPGATPISRRQLSGQYIPQEVAKIRARAKEAAHHKLATLQLDGWGGINFHHFLAFMITTQDRKLHTVKVMDTSADRKTAEEVLRLINLVWNTLRTEWGVILVAITTDASGETKKARRLAIEANPSLIAPDCWAHQVIVYVPV
ncbi:hypothetical protein CPB83DRAFT_766516 [Crepidotus variabilis]|uniref:DUF659 domain-containing protein n=1 Tax=Crepidotus variabilis TaxID=179855 RepID=A0A9P6EH40_9AGAR|nr:hypothetical protein CPB83DRAFT_766516 [Crepidotus variabilis]